jgi:hypothetical protein
MTDPRFSARRRHRAPVRSLREDGAALDCRRTLPSVKVRGMRLVPRKAVERLLSHGVRRLFVSIASRDAGIKIEPSTGRVRYPLQPQDRVVSRRAIRVKTHKTGNSVKSNRFQISPS